jgi:hypothetical protein
VKARPFAFSLLAGLFALVSSGVITGQSLTRAPFRTVSTAAYPEDFAVSGPAHLLIAAALQPSSPSDDDTPWGFFRKNVKHADSLTKWLALIFFTSC